MLNRKRLNKASGQGLLHKIGKRWGTISLALLMMVGFGTVATYKSASASGCNHQMITTTVHHQKPWSNQNHQRSMRIGAGRYQLGLVRSHYVKTRNRRRLRASGYGRINEYFGTGIPRYFIYNRFAPNSRRASVPRNFRIKNNLVWVVGNLKVITKYNYSVDIYMYQQSLHAWIYIPGTHRYGRKRIHRNNRQRNGAKRARRQAKVRRSVN